MKIRLIDKARFWISGLKKSIHGSENVVRFVYHKSKVAPSRGQLKRTAFEPPKDYPDEISVFRSLELSEKEILNLSRYVQANIEPIGYGNIICEEIRGLANFADNIQEAEAMSDLDLDVEAFPRPHPRHANIVNIPTSTNKAYQILVATKLGLRSRFTSV